MGPPEIELSTEKIRNLPMRIISAGSGAIWMCPGITDRLLEISVFKDFIVVVALSHLGP